MQHVAELLPHQPPMRLLDQILAYDDTQIWATTSITSKFPFTNRLGLHACFGLELMAQTAAAFFTLAADNHDAPRQGMLIASRSYTTSQAYYPQRSHLLINARLESALPNDTRGATLVRFSGYISVFNDPAAMPADPHALAESGAELAVTKATMSVYL